MIILTGPQTTEDERGDLFEAAGMLGALLAGSASVAWTDAERMLTLPGWEGCPVAVADVDLATALGLPVDPVTALYN